MIDLNLTGAFACAQRAARIMVDGGEGGRIVNVTSVHEHIPLRGAAALPAGRPGNAYLIAEAIAFLAHPDARYATGASMVVDGGLMLTAAEFNREAASS